METKYQWIPFYKSLAEKILGYKDKKAELYNIIKELSKKEPLMKYLHFERDDWWGPRNYEIDPFSIMAILNRQATEKSRSDLAKVFADTFNIKDPIPEKFETIPVLNNLQSVFVAGKDELWELFIEAIKAADENSFSTDFYKAFDKAISIKGNGLASITITLYWIRPHTFMPLDSRSRTYISEKLNTKVPKYKCTGNEYVTFLYELKKEIEKQTPKLTFLDVSKEAWDYTNEPVINPKPVSTNYWWLNANPKIWKFSDIPVGEEDFYSLYNEKGNKRKMFKNFLEAKKDEIVIGYEASPVMKIVAICRISKEQDGERIYFEKTEDLRNSIDYSLLKEQPELEKMQYFKNSQGSLYKLSQEEYDIIMEIIQKHNSLSSPEDNVDVNKYTKEDFLNEVYIQEESYNRLVSVLKRKKNIILQGAPGVGKTFAARRLAHSIIEAKNDEQVAFIQFHQSYSYEDFMMGYKPDGNGFKLEFGIFYEFCKKASEQTDKDFFFIIDEINRGNMSKIFGELLMLIESDYRRDEEVILAYNHMPFKIPDNLYIIGLMNTADRSLAMIDYALRRRFSFFEMNPAFDSDGFRSYQKSIDNAKFDELVLKINELNKEIETDNSLGRGFCIGHSYLCNIKNCKDEILKNIIEFDIIPMLKEYWFEDKNKVQKWENIFSDIFK